MSSTQTKPPPGPPEAPGQTKSVRSAKERSGSAPRRRGDLPRRFLLGLVWAVVTLGLVLFYYKRFFPGNLTDGDAMDYAQIARNIAEGHGFASSVLRPLAFAGDVPFVAIDGRSGTIPDLSHAPLYPFVLALAFLLRGGHGGAPAVEAVCLLLFLASVYGVYQLARLLFPTEHQPWIALLSAGLYILGGEALHFAITGLPVMLATVLVTFLLMALYRAHETAGRPVPPGGPFVVGLLLGLCTLTQYSLLLLVVPTLVYVFASRAPARAWRGGAACLGGFLLVTLGWMIRSAMVGHGNPFFNMLLYGVMADTAEYPGTTTIYRSVAPDQGPFLFFFAHLPEMAAKASRGLSFYRDNFLQAFNFFTLAAAAVSLLWRAPDVRLNALRAYVAFCLLSLILATSVFAPSLAMLAPFGAVITVVAVGFLFQVLQQQRWQPLAQRVAVWCFAALVALGLTSQLVGAGKPSVNPIYKGIQMLMKPPILPGSPISDSADQQMTAKAIAGGTVMTDAPWEVSWDTSLSCVWIPDDDRAYEQIKGKIPKGLSINALLLTPTIASYNAGAGEATPWTRLSLNPQALQIYQIQSASVPKKIEQQFKERVALLRKLVAAKDPRIKESPAEIEAQIADARLNLPRSIDNEKATLKANFAANYGPIAEVMQDFYAVGQQVEDDQLKSTLFVNRQVLIDMAAKKKSQ